MSLSLIICILIMFFAGIVTKLKPKPEMTASAKKLSCRIVSRTLLADRNAACDTHMHQAISDKPLFQAQAFTAPGIGWLLP